MLTLRTLVDEMGLDLVSGAEAAESPIRWVHSSELADPTPWLSGGELILTTGLQLTSPKRQREFARRLSDHHLAGVGFGTGIEHDSIPKPLVDEARTLGFPVFEVPYELPFIAITEKAFRRLVNEQYEVLQRGIATHKRLERLVLEERGLGEVARALAAAIGGAVLVLDGRGEIMAERALPPRDPQPAVEWLREAVRERTPATESETGELPSSRPTTPTWPVARWRCPWPREGAGRRARGWWPCATRAGSARPSS